MSFDQLLLIGVAVGLVLVALSFFIGRKDKGARRSGARAAAAEPASGAADTTDDAVARLAETVGALRRLAALKDEELERDTAFREEVRTGWRPMTPAAFSAPPAAETQTPPATADVVTAPSSPDVLTAPSEETGTVSAPEASPTLPPLVTQVSQVQLDHSTKMHPDSAAKLRLSVGQAFTPAAPVARRDLFAGRVQQLETLVDVVFERGQHAIVYGERGVGKTSLASVLTLVFEDEPKKLPIRVNCDAGDTFDSVWRKVLDELEVAVDGREGLVRPRAAVERALGKEKLTPSDATRLLKHVGPDIEAIVIIDEFDTIADPQAARLFADSIKMLSDQLVPSTVILLGVADTLDELLTEHASVSRALVHVHMPRMSVEELKDIVRRGLDLLTMDVEDEALDLIARLSQGFPHFTHLLAQAAARCAIDAQRPLVSVADVNHATKKVAGRIEAWIEDAYEKATASAHDAIYAQVLLAGALAGTDDRGYFAATDVKRPMTQIMGKSYEIPSFIRQLNALSEADRGPVLVKTGTERKHRYRFVEAQMEPYVIMRSLSDGLIEPALLRALHSNGAATPA